MIRLANIGDPKPSVGTLPDRALKLAESIRGAWLCNDYPASFLQDVSGWNNTAAFMAAPNDPSWATGRNAGDWAVDFDGNDYAQVADQWAIREFPTGISVVVWTYRNATPAAGYGYAAKNACADYGLRCDNTDTGYWQVGAVSSATAVGAMPVGEWCQLVGTYDGADQWFYLNGVLEDTDPNVGGVPATANPLQFGTYNPGARDLDGRIDHIIIFGRCLDVEEVELLLEFPFAPLATGQLLPIDHVVRPPGQSETYWDWVRGRVRR